MAVTLTPRFGLPQYGAGSDNPSRLAWNAAWLALDQGAAKDAGAVGGTTLPSTGLVDGTYAQTVDGAYRKLYRRAASSWQQVGGNTWGETIYARADSALATGSPARQVSHPNLTNPGIVENWDGSSVRGGRQAIGDVNAAQPGALHVGDTAIGVDLTARGRIYARTTAAGHRAIVASAHDAGAGPLFTAREAGGTDPWFVDSLGRMRAQAPTAFGAAGLTAGVPLVSAPGSGDATAADLYAAAGKTALRVLRALGDATPIASFGQDQITLGRSGWAGARVDLIAPNIGIAGALGVVGATTVQQLTAGTTSVSSLTATGAVQGAGVTATGGLSAEGGKVYSSTSGSGATVVSRPPAQYSGTSVASLRESHVGYSVRNPNLGIAGGSEGAYDMPVTMPESGWMRLDASLRVRAETGSSNTLETMRFNVVFELRDNSGNVIEAGYTHVNSVTSDDTSRQISGFCSITLTDLFWSRISAGDYTIRLRHIRGTVLGGYIESIRYIVTPVVLAGVNSS